MPQRPTGRTLALGLLILCLLLSFAAPASARQPNREATIVALELPAGADAAPGAIVRAAADAPLDPVRLPDGSKAEPLPGFAALRAPTAPVTLLREALLRGRRIAVYAVTAGGPTAAALAAGLGPGTRLVDAPTLAGFDRAPFVTDAPAPDPAASAPAWKITVAATGMQRIDAAALAAAGLAPGSFDPASLQLRHRGREVALEELRGEGGALAAIGFYAKPGDRWNAASVYWLTVGTEPGLRMAIRDTSALSSSAGAPAEAGAWRTNTILETRLPGPDSDRFFSADLRTAPLAAGGTPAVVTATIAPRLPPANGELRLTLSGGSLFDGVHTLRVTVAGTTHTHSWSGKDTWSAQFRFPAWAPEAVVELLPRAASDNVHLDAVAWEVPVRLELGGAGAGFTGQAGRAIYTLTGLPEGAALYDVGDPERPARLTFGGEHFEDGGDKPRPYLVTGPGTLHTPALTRHTPVDLSQELNAEAVYIAPAAFIAALEPLLQHRRAQGLRVAAVSTEAIYDSWASGHVSPEAIRSFLRFAAERWAAAPTAVVLVGDGSSDPRDYLGRGNRTWVPPYLAEADPWIGETACDACYARLNGEDPLADILPDLSFGRIPAKSVDELRALVQKILAYETSQSPGTWWGTVAFVADNPDLGGDFIRAAERSASLQPAGARIRRVYFDPDAPADDPWRTADPLAALARSMGALDAGAAVVHYVGHGLQFQWGFTGPPLRPGEPTDRQYLLGLFGVDELRNGTRLPVVLSMTCLTGSFQIPAFSGTAIDERLVARADGGAIAAWSSTGLGVLFGHEALQRGFYRALWDAPGAARLGELTLAGYIELFTTERCCQESIGTFVLLGDPLTAPRVNLDVRTVSLPLVKR